VDAEVLRLPELQARIEKVLEPMNYRKPVVARIAGNELYFSEGVYERPQGGSRSHESSRQRDFDVPGVAAVYRAEELGKRHDTHSANAKGGGAQLFCGTQRRSLCAAETYWLMDNSTDGSKRVTGTSHGTPYNYDQHVPVFSWGLASSRENILSR